ncbi:6969_t:CDS:1, partial [Racocetra persica]
LLQKANKIDKKFKDLYLLKKANSFHDERKFIEKWNILAKLSESKTEYNFDAKFWMATSLSMRLDINKDEECAYNYFKEVSNYFNHNLEKNYFYDRVEDRRLCIEFDSDMKPKLTIIVINNHVWDWY